MSRRVSQRTDGDGRRERTEDAEALQRAEQEESTEEESQEESDYSEDDDVSWIQWFCALKGNEFFTEVPDDYIRDDFNLTGLANQVPYYDYALDMVLDADLPDEEALNDDQQELVESAAEIMYGLIHARFLLTSRGLAAMYEKFKRMEFGRCPRVECRGQPVLPAGQSDIPQKHAVKVYCLRCQDLYYPKSSRRGGIDGAYFGTSFPHLLKLQYPEIESGEIPEPYVPRVYGFRLHNPATSKDKEARRAPGRRITSK
mmetsp:Transcript_47867/g.112543  ORF Transcript_47867/g.112543 Transcript_47867/m.112543 type:complete len:257 (-) Transcript_47867:1605-2375(-)